MGGESSADRLIAGEDLAGVELCAFAGGEVAAFTTRSPDKQSVNEDAIGLFEVGNARGLLGVADGMGGGAQGERASRLALECLREAARGAVGSEEGETLRSPILDVFEEANRRVLDLGVGAATTLCVAEVAGADLRVYHVGDSEALVVGQRGRVKLQTVAHSPTGYAVEAGFLDEREALHHGDRHLILNVLGTTDMRIELGSRIRMAARDTLLLASDGVFDNLALAEIGELIRTGPLARAAERLAALCRARMQEPVEGHPSKPDDLAFVLFRRARRDQRDD